MWCRPRGWLLFGICAIQATWIANVVFSVFNKCLSGPLEVLGTENRFGGYYVPEVNESLFDCSPEIFSEELGVGWQKIVYSLSNNRAAKVPRLFGPAYHQCFNTGGSHKKCENDLLHSFISEIKWLHLFDSVSGIVKMISYCIPPDATEDISKVRVVVEKGEPLTSLTLIQSSWEQRRHIVLDIIETLLKLKEFSFTDFRRQQFVLINGKAKLSDLDHIHHEPQDEPWMSEKILREFMPFLLTNDAPPAFLVSAKSNNTSLFALHELLSDEGSGLLYRSNSTGCH